MATWIDLFALFATISVLTAIVYAILFVVKSVNQGVNATKESLKSRGLDVSASGVAVKTSRRFDREDYVDATQRGFVKALNASSIRKGDGTTAPVPLAREHSSSSVASSDGSKKKKKGALGGRK
ncbi:unnamed protein product [Cyclocybe aegerita]|uniref:Uncharacterized protein n=1 Tax=Cyclocybe aegerita TaxID=1973307 RepID=A0A8S0W016_CYCAE|nr:unnamed protein product [Cyclocybe aegerita]